MSHGLSGWWVELLTLAVQCREESMAAQKKSKRRQPRASDASTRRAASEVGAKWRSTPSQPPLDEELSPAPSSDPQAISEDAEISLDAEADSDIELLDPDSRSDDDRSAARLADGSNDELHGGDAADTDPATDEPISRPPSSLAVLFHEVTDDDARWESEPGKKLSELRDEAKARAAPRPRPQQSAPMRKGRRQLPAEERPARPPGVRDRGATPTGARRHTGTRPKRNDERTAPAHPRPRVPLSNESDSASSPRIAANSVRCSSVTSS